VSHGQQVTMTREQPRDDGFGRFGDGPGVPACDGFALPVEQRRNALIG
jgi:hypothetical protein